ncbi:unnamed protein product, partial [Rotaria sp. Silwood1]
PYIDVDDLDATFISSTGISMTMSGFWDGGQTWKIRFAPMLDGIWTYTTKANDSGLNNQTGFITCIPYTGTLSIYQHGFIKPSANNRYLTYADGKPFYWLGDTHWSGFNIAERFNESNDVRFTSMFQGMIDRRVEQGFTVWKAETFANNNEQGNPARNEGGPAWNNGKFFIDLNPSFWQNIDQRIEYLASKGMAISIAQGIGRSMKNASAESDHKRLARYILARYGAYLTVWITTQEYNDVHSGACGQYWANVAAYVYDLDPYKRANIMHNAYTNPIVYHDQLWYGFVTLQQSHKRQSQIAVTFGFTYGTQGIWWGCYTTIDKNYNCGNGSDARAWNTAIDFPVGEQMSMMARFWTSFEWWVLAPDGNAIIWSSAPNNTQKPYQKTDGNNRTLVIAYLPLQLNGTVYNGTVRNLSPTGVYTAQWFNPRNGTYSTIDKGWIPSKAGLWNIPAQPTSTDDWVLKIQRINGSNTSPNFAFGMRTRSSSNRNINQTSNKVVDGDMRTNWQVNDAQGFNNSWLAVDFRVNTTFNKVCIIEYGLRTAGYRIEYWNGNYWLVANMGFTINREGVTFTAVTGSQMRIIFTSEIGQSPIVYELEIYDSISIDT